MSSMNPGPDNGTDHRHLRLLLAALGLLQGVGFFLLFEIAEESWARMDVAYAIGVFLVVGPVWFALCYGMGNRLRTALGVGAYSLLLVVLWFGFDGRVEWFRGADDPGAAAGYFAFLAILASYILLPFFQSWLCEGRPRFPYPRLFVQAWSNGIILIVAAIFVGLSWAVLGLWMGLFNLIDVSFFEDLFTDAGFAWPFSGLMLGLGIAIARENAKIVPALRRMVLLICQFLAPVLAAAALLFLLALPFTGLAPLWDRTSATLVLTSVLAVLALLSNAVIQDGEQDERTPGWMNRLLALALLLSPAFGGLALYAIGLRIGQYGLTPERFAGLLIVIVATIHALTYALGVVLRRLQWAAFVQRANRYLAITVALVALLVATPVLNPFEWSARNQIKRLEDGRADATEFDFGYLKFKLGAPGREALAEIRGWSDHEQQAMIEEKLTEVEAANDYYTWRGRVPRPPQQRLTREHFELVPEPFEIPDGLIADLERTAMSEGGRACDERPCLLARLDLNGDGEPDYLVLTAPIRPRIIVMIGEKDAWRPLYSSDPGASHVYERDYEALRRGEYELVEPSYSDIRIGESIIRY